MDSSSRLIQPSIITVTTTALITSLTDAPTSSTAGSYAATTDNPFLPEIFAPGGAGIVFGTVFGFAAQILMIYIMLKLRRRWDRRIRQGKAQEKEDSTSPYSPPGGRHELDPEKRIHVHEAEGNEYKERELPVLGATVHEANGVVPKELHGEGVIAELDAVATRWAVPGIRRWSWNGGETEKI